MQLRKGTRALPGLQTANTYSCFGGLMPVETVIAVNLNLPDFLRVETLFALILGQIFSQCFSISDRLICSDLSSDLSFMRPHKTRAAYMTNRRQRSHITHASIDHLPFHGCFLSSTSKSDRCTERKSHAAHSARAPNPI